MDIPAALVEVALFPISPAGIAKFTQKWFKTEVTRQKQTKMLADGEEEEQSRQIGTSHWTDKVETQDQSSVVRGAFACFDTIYNFLAAAKTVEKAFFAVYLRILDESGCIIATDHGHTLSLKSIDREEQAFENVATFINHTTYLASIVENDYPKESCTVTVDASICGNPASPRNPPDNKGFIRMTKIAIRALLEIARVDSNVEHVHIVPGETVEVPKNTTSLAFITADWENKTAQSVHLVRKVRSVAQASSTDIDALLQSIEKIDIDKGRQNIFLLGNTGAGKSYSGNWILNSLGDTGVERFTESESGSMTSYVDYLPRRDDCAYRVWDTPGLNDSYGRDAKFIYDIEKALFEAGSIHVVILCIANLERIDDAMKKCLRVYSRIIDRELSKRLIVFVNRQPREVKTLQKKNLINEIRVNCGITLEMTQIFDMNPKLAAVVLTKREAISLLQRYCNMDGVKTNKMADMVDGLKKVQGLKDQGKRMFAEAELLNLSSMALRKILTGGNKEHPRKVQPSLGTSIIMSSGKVYEMRDGYERVIEYHLQMPQHIRKRFDRRLTLFGKCLRLWNADVDKVISTVKSMKLVFRMLPDERSDGQRHGVLREVYKVNLQLWGMHDALLDDVRYQVQRILGCSEQREVTYFGKGGSSLESECDNTENKAKK